eukprot:9490101-Pyramimonas_sp.AAC.1
MAVYARCATVVDTTAGSHQYRSVPSAVSGAHLCASPGLVVRTTSTWSKKKRKVSILIPPASTERGMLFVNVADGMMGVFNPPPLSARVSSCRRCSSPRTTRRSSAAWHLTTCLFLDPSSTRLFFTLMHVCTPPCVRIILIIYYI